MQLPFQLAPFWGHGLRIWLATSLALYAAFWLELESPVSAAITVAILAQPRRGQALSRALYRFGATLVGGVVAIGLVALFGQDRVLLLAAFTAWLGVCVFGAAYLPGDQAYGAVLSGYTVAMIVIANIDRPQNVVMETFERVSAVSVGIAAVTLVNICLRSPDVRHGLRASLLAAIALTRDFVRRTLLDGDTGAERVAALLSVLVALRADAALIRTETTDGARRAAGARSAIAGLSGMAAASRTLALPGTPSSRATGQQVRAICLAAIEGTPAAGLRGVLCRETAAGGGTPDGVLAVQAGLDLVCAWDHVQDGLRAFETGARPLRDIALPVHRDFAVAIRDAVRIMVAFGISAALFIVSGWPATSTALALVATLCALSATSPSASAFAKGALVSLPIAVVAAGVIRFVILDGGQGFPTLAAPMAPVIFLGCFLGLRKGTAFVGFLLNVLLPTFLSPGNPQSYDLQPFLDTAVLAAAAVVLLALTSRLVLPVSAAQKMGWSLHSARRNLAVVVAGRVSPRGQQRARGDDRIAQFTTATGTGARLEHAGLTNMVFIADLTVALSSGLVALRQAGTGAALLPLRRRCRTALHQADAGGLSTVADALLALVPDTAAGLRPQVIAAVAGLGAASRLLKSTEGLSDPERAERINGVRIVMRQATGWSRMLSVVLRAGTTALIGLAALIGGAVIWDAYVMAPWTRDGRVRVQVVAVAPRVSGEITGVDIVDNQLVHKGDLLFVIDPFDFSVSLASAAAEVESRQADLLDKQTRNDRRQTLTTLSTSLEEKENYDASFKMAQAALANATAQRAQAQINLNRTEIRSPVNGYVTNLLLRPGDYATAGVVDISVIDTDSYWVDGYFEETKLPRMRIGDPATIRLMGYAAPLQGRVESITRGISSAQAVPSAQGLPDIDPVYTWVRLAQRIPIRIRISHVPAGIPLVAGMTCTVSVEEPADRRGGWLHDLRLRLAI